MLRKRLIGVITILNGLAVQSFSYKRYLPLGRPECIAENLDRWGADEILIQLIDRTGELSSPDIDLVKKIANSGISTPLIYAGGILSETDAANVIRAGADRICIDQLLNTNPQEIRNIAHRLGAQAIIASFPLAMGENNKPYWYDYRENHTKDLNEEILSLINDHVISEVLLTDYQHEGIPNSFDFKLLSMFSNNKIPLILFGGLSEQEQFEQALLNPQVSAVAVGNFLNYREHSIQLIKSKLDVMPIRSPFYCERSVI